MIEVKNGKLLQDGVVVRPEFGNDEHLKAIKKSQERIDQLVNGIPIDFNEETKIVIDTTFTCKCEKRVYVEFEFDDVNWEDKIIGETTRCRHCNQKWEIIDDPDDDGHLLKMSE